jgi:hypothetical protein
MSDHADAYSNRWKEEGISIFVATLCPTGASRPVVAQCVAETIKTAHSYDPASWGVTKRRGFIRLSVGTPEALVWAPGGHAMDVQQEKFPNAPFLALMVDIPTLERSGVTEEIAALLMDYGLSTTPDSLYAAIPTDDADTFARLNCSLRDAHFRHLQIASRMRLNPAVKGAHHPGLGDEIGRLSGQVLPQPSYVKVTAPSGS